MIDRVRHLALEEDRSDEQIGIALDMSLTAVVETRRAAGIPSKFQRHIERTIEPRRRDVEAMLERGMNLTQIAAELHVSIGAVSHDIRHIRARRLAS